MENYIKLESISLKNHPEFNEKWVQNKIEEDPRILGLGDLSLRQSEKIQQSGGRVDILLQDDDSNTRYTIELQLGKTDETHIITNRLNHRLRRCDRKRFDRPWVEAA